MVVASITKEQIYCVIRNHDGQNVDFFRKYSSSIFLSYRVKGDATLLLNNTLKC